MSVSYFLSILNLTAPIRWSKNSSVKFQRIPEHAYVSFGGFISIVTISNEKNLRRWLIVSADIDNQIFLESD